MTARAFSVVRQDAFPTIVASPDPLFRRRILQKLATHAETAGEVCGGAEALARLEAGACRAVVLDQCLPDLEVNELVGMIRKQHPEVEVIVVDSEGIKMPGGDGRSLSPGSHELFHLLQNSGSPRLPTDLAPPGVASRSSLSSSVESPPLPGMKGESPSLRRVYRLARLVAPRRTTVLLTGETGTGKELIAQGVHALSPRHDRPFVIINCAAIPEPLLEAELFGYNRGAFTGAFQSRLGRLQLAHGGTVLLDEVGDLPLSMQAKLLRFLQEGEIQRLGSTECMRVDVRIIAATNANLPKLVREGRFREDLFYRLAVFPIEVDPLRQRREDIAPLSNLFLDLLCQEARVPIRTFAPQARTLLGQYAWPGNVRELRQVIERAFILAEEQSELRAEHFSLGTGELLSQKNLRTVA